MIKRLLFWFIAPFALPQGLLLRKNAPRFKGAQGLPYGIAQPKLITNPVIANKKDKPCTILGFGDSIIAGVGIDKTEHTLVGQVAKLLAAKNQQTVGWRLLGKSGYNSSQMLQESIFLLPKENFDIIIVSVGVNDITSLARTKTWRANLNLLLDQLTAHSPKAFIVFTGTPPLHGFPLLPKLLQFLFGMRAKTFDKISCEEIAKRKNCILMPTEFVPSEDMFAADGYHPNQESCGIWAKQLTEIITIKNDKSVTN